MSVVKLPQLVSTIVNSSCITAENVRQLRATVFKNETVEHHEAEMLLILDDSAGEKSTEWSHFFVEAFVDYIVHQAKPTGSISNSNANWLINNFSGEGFINSAEQLEALVKILERATSTPESLMKYALKQVSQAVMENQGPVQSRRDKGKRIICDSDVELIRRLIFAHGGEGGLAVTQMEAEFLFDLNDKTVELENSLAWSSLFVRGVANYVLATLGERVPAKNFTLEKDVWLTGDGFFNQLVNSLRSVYKEMRSPLDAIEASYSGKNKMIQQDIEKAAIITADEVQWVVERIKTDGDIHKNEIALLQFLKGEAEQFHPEFKELLDQAA